MLSPVGGLSIPSSRPRVRCVVGNHPPTFPSNRFGVGYCSSRSFSLPLPVLASSCIYVTQRVPTNSGLFLLIMQGIPFSCLVASPFIRRGVYPDPSGNENYTIPMGVIYSSQTFLAIRNAASVPLKERRSVPGGKPGRIESNVTVGVYDSVAFPLCIIAISVDSLVVPESSSSLVVQLIF